MLVFKSRICLFSMNQRDGRKGVLKVLHGQTTKLKYCNLQGIVRMQSQALSNSWLCTHYHGKIVKVPGWLCFDIGCLDYLLSYAASETRLDAIFFSFFLTISADSLIWTDFELVKLRAQILRLYSTQDWKIMGCVDGIPWINLLNGIACYSLFYWPMKEKS
jgi:hypothetical protein